PSSSHHRTTRAAMRMVSSFDECSTIRTLPSERPRRLDRMSRGLFIVVVVAVGAMSARAGEPDASSETFFELKVRPVLAGSCVKCHGEKKSSGGLRLDSRDALLSGGDNGPAVVPGDPEASLLIRAIRRSDKTLKMP